MNKKLRFAITAAMMACAINSHAQSWRGLDVADEDRCADYSVGDYAYPQSVEDEIIASYGGVYSPYTGNWFDSGAKTDIEHIVARAEAHDSGLCAAPEETRTAFAGDLLNLTLADPGTNRDIKREKDAADWLPDNNRCWFANRVVRVKRKYGLTVDAAERDALEQVLSNCESVDLVLHPAAAGPVSGIYIANGAREALVIIQDREGDSVNITLYYDMGADNSIVPMGWAAEFGEIEEPPANFARYFPSGEARIIEEQPAQAN